MENDTKNGNEKQNFKMHQFWQWKMVLRMAMENGTLKCTSFGNGKRNKDWQCKMVQRLN